MLPFGSATQLGTSFLGQSTPVNQNRSTSGFLFNSTPAQPSALASTSLFGGTTPSTSTLQVSSTGSGTIHKYDPVSSVDKIVKNGMNTQIRTRLCNVCAMTVYEKKSMEELRLEDYIDNRKFSSTVTNLFPSATPLFGGALPTANLATPTPSLFGTPAAAATSTLNSSLFGNKPVGTTAPTLSFSFGAATATTSSTPFAFGSSTTTTAAPTAAFGTVVPATAPITSTSPFTFGSAAPAAATTAAAPAFGFGAPNTSLFSAATTTAGASFGFPVTKPATTSAFTFGPTATTSAAPSFNLFPTAATSAAPSFSLFPTATTAAPTLFTAATAAQPNVLTAQSSVDARTHLQLFQTMLNIQPFNNELGFLARNIKPSIGLDRARLRTAPDSTNVHPINNVFSPLLTKPSVLPSGTSTPPSTLVHPLPTHSHTLPSVLLPVSATNSSIALFGKRKLADSFLDDDDDNSLMMDDGPSSVHKITKANAIKRPRVLDMNKIRSVVLGGGGGGGGGNLETSIKEEQFSETFVVKSSSENLSGWKKFATYDAYLASKKPLIEEVKIIVEEKVVSSVDNQFDQERAFRLPRLTQDDYYTKPTIDELGQCFNKQGQCLVKEFTVGREHYGSVTFQGSKMNLAGLDLNQLIEISRRQVTVYPDDNKKPIEGEELNCQAIISLLGVYPIDRSRINNGEEITDPDRLIDMNYGNYLREMTKKFHGKFLDYDVYTGTWAFKVEHF